MSTKHLSLQPTLEQFETSLLLLTSSLTLHNWPDDYVSLATSLMAESQGLEPWIPFGTTVFKTARLPIITTLHKKMSLFKSCSGFVFKECFIMSTFTSRWWAALDLNQMRHSQLIYSQRRFPIRYTDPCILTSIICLYEWKILCRLDLEYLDANR